MSTPPKPNPAIYLKLRSNALQAPLPDLATDLVHVVLMDWHVGAGTASVLAASDGTASIYLSNGGGFLGGGQKSTTVHTLALKAVQLARIAAPLCEHTDTIDLPAAGEVFFYLRSNSGLRRGAATEAAMSSGKDPLVALGNAMQQIVSAYRAISSMQPSKKPSP